MRQEWCGCGTLEALVDGNGKRTEWQRDARGRVTREVRGDGAGDIQYVYENTTSRLKQIIDAKGQVTNFTYDISDDVTTVTYTNATIATPGVAYTYDPNYKRIVTMVDQTGTTALTYRALGTLGAGQVATIDGPLTNDTLTYTYDALGRVASRSVNGTGSAWSYDDLGRIETETNALGVFTYTYDGLSNRINSVAYPNGQSSSYAYFDETGDRRLQTVHHRKPGNVTLSRFDFTYDKAGNIRTQDIQHDASAPTRWTYEYDVAGQLRFARHTTTGGTPAELVRHAYAYDRSGNRTTEQIDDAILTTTHDNMNRMLAQTPGGTMRIAGSINEPGLVNVDHRAATMDADNAFFVAIPLVTGLNTFTVRATDASGNTAAQAYEFTVAGGSQTFTHDANGNLTSDGVRTFDWDAADRLVAVEEGTQRIEYTYNGVGQRTQTVKKTSGVTDWTRRLVWAETEPAEERDAAGTAVVKRYVAQGVKEGADDYFYTRDHLGSLVNLTDASLTLRARYAYDPYGRGTRTTGNRDADIGFTGHMLDRDADLTLTYFRGYDPSLGRWLSRDPLGLSAGPNAYAYGNGDPANTVDPLGLHPLVAFLIGGAIVGLATQVFADVVAGNVSSWQSYAAAAGGGALGGAAVLYSTALAAGIVAGASTNLIRQGLDYATGKRCGFDGLGFAVETGFGAFSGLLGSAGFRMLQGNGSLGHVARTQVTRFLRGQTVPTNPSTLAKMFIGRAGDQGFFTSMVPGAVASGAGILPSSGNGCDCK